MNCFIDYLNIQESSVNLEKRLEDLAQMSGLVDFNYSDIMKRNKKNDSKIKKLIKELVDDYDFDLDDEDTEDIQNKINKLIKG